MGYQSGFGEADSSFPVDIEKYNRKEDGGVDINYLLEKDGLSIDKLISLSYKSTFDKTLKKSLDCFDKECLLREIDDIVDWYDDEPQGNILDNVAIDYRIKAKQSAHLKYDRYYPKSSAERVFNDLLGFRSLCDSYEHIFELKNEEHFRIADMSKGKAKDDGYRGIHVYFQPDHYHYPIEIQYNTYYDRQINNWLHAFLYKKGVDDSIGKMMRAEYEKGNVKSEQEFQEVLKHVLSNC